MTNNKVLLLIPVVASLFLFAAFAGAEQQTMIAHLSIANTTNRDRNPSFWVGDSWELNITTSPVIANAPVELCGIQDGTDLGCTNFGSTDGNGRWSLSGSHDSSVIGFWAEWAKVGNDGILSSSILFDVHNGNTSYPTPTPVYTPTPTPTPTPISYATVSITNTSNPSRNPNFWVGDSWRLNVSTNPPIRNKGVEMCGTQNTANLGCTPFGANTDNNGQWSLTGTMDSSTIGYWTEWSRVNGNVVSNNISFNVTARPTPTPSRTPTPTPVYTPTPTPTPTPVPCSNISSYVSGNITSNGINDGTAEARIRNSSTNCTYRVGFASYKMYITELQPSWLENQTLHDSISITLNPGEEKTLQVRVPNCRFQLDLFEGSAITPPYYNTSGHRLFASQWAGSPLCSASTPTPTPSRTPTPTPSRTPTPTPSRTPTPTPTPSRTPTPTLTPTPTPTPTPTLASLVCSPFGITVNRLQNANLNASGGNGSYFWTTTGGNISSGTGSSFSVNYSQSGTYLVNLYSGTQVSQCYVNVFLDNVPTPTPTPGFHSLTIQKQVRNLSDGTGENESVNADPNESIEFIVKVTANGNATIFNVNVLDGLPGNLSYVNGSTTLDGSVRNDSITSSGLFIGDLSPGQTRTLRFRTNVAGDSAFSSGTTTLTNVATAFANNISTVNDTASVVVTKSNLNQNLTMSITKLGRNITRGENTELGSINASPNDTIEFVIRARSLSLTTINNVIIKDVLPNGLSYISNTTSVNGNIVANGINASGINIGSLSPSQEAIIRFSATVAPASSFIVGTTTVNNVVQASADNLSTITAQLPISIVNGQVAGTSITKVAGVSTGTAESLMLSLLLSALATFMYMGYTRTGVFKKREALASIRRHRSDKDHFNFAI
ncbi:MAG TPA: hypothetical protein VJH71_00535 [Candidatus Paceibacterota bacterium]